MFKSIRAASVSSPVLVLGIHAADRMTLPPASAKNEAASAALKNPAFKGECGETFTVDSKTILVGLGKADDLTTAALRTAGGRVIRALDRLGARGAEIILPELKAKSLSAFAAGRALGEGMGLANWRVDFFEGKATRNKPHLPAISVAAKTRDLNDGLGHGLLLAESTNYARRLAATPPNIATPAHIAAEARKLARETNLTCKVIDYRQAEKLGMGGLVNVGKGSANKPCMIILEHKPRTISRKAKGQTIALVGKTVTYDTGGYSLKVNNGMKGMKYDKCGGMAVLGAMHAVATMKLPVHVVAILPTAENMVSDDSYRPDDIITISNGITVEVTNTDAEGRLVLADGLVYACRQYKPTAVVDVATLTGGVVVALGRFCAGYFCNDDKLRDRVQKAADLSGEKIWQLPLWKEHKDFMRSAHADILNSNPARDAHPVQGAAFLSYFVEDNIPWAHLDIAGMGNVDGERDVFVAGPTGYGVRLLTDLVESYA